MKILVAEPNKEAYVKKISGTLEEMQEIVSGYIEPVYVDENVILVCNEEGLFRDDLDWNRFVIFPYKRFPVKGAFFLCSKDGEGDFVSLPDELIRKYISI